jgi:hypothetical protein
MPVEIENLFDRKSNDWKVLLTLASCGRTVTGDQGKGDSILMRGEDEEREQATLMQYKKCLPYGVPALYARAQR